MEMDRLIRCDLFGAERCSTKSEVAIQKSDTRLHFRYSQAYNNLNFQISRLAGRLESLQSQLKPLQETRSLGVRSKTEKE